MVGEGYRLGGQKTRGQRELEGVELKVRINEMTVMGVFWGGEIRNQLDLNWTLIIGMISYLLHIQVDKRSSQCTGCPGTIGKKDYRFNPTRKRRW